MHKLCVMHGVRNICQWAYITSVEAFTVGLVFGIFLSSALICLSWLKTSLVFTVTAIAFGHSIIHVRACQTWAVTILFSSVVLFWPVEGMFCDVSVPA